MISQQLSIQLNCRPRKALPSILSLDPASLTALHQQQEAAAQVVMDRQVRQTTGRSTLRMSAGLSFKNESTSEEEEE